MAHEKGRERHILWIIMWRLDGVTHRMVDSPHKHAEQRVAGTEELHFLSNEVFFLGLRFTRNGCGNAARRSHLKANWLVNAVCAIISTVSSLEAGTVATGSRLTHTSTIHLASSQIKAPQIFSSSTSHTAWLAIWPFLYQDWYDAICLS